MAAIKEFAFALRVARVVLTKENVTAVVTRPKFVRSPLRLISSSNNKNKKKKRGRDQSKWSWAAMKNVSIVLLKWYHNMRRYEDEWLVGRGTVDTESARGIPINQLTILFDQRGEIKKRPKNRSCSRIFLDGLGGKLVFLYIIPEIQRVDFHWSLDTLLLMKMDDSVSKTELRS